jgi:hypothetical protein
VEKMYPVATFTWAFGDAAWTNICTVHFPKVLYDKPFIASTLEGYMWHRSDVEWIVQINSSKFHNGKLFVTTIARANELHESFNLAMKRINHKSCRELYAGSVNETRGTLFRRAPVAWDRIRGDGYHDEQIGTLCIDVQNPLSSLKTGEPTSVQGMVYAKFANTDVKGFGPQGSSVVLAKIRRVQKLMEGRSEKHSGKGKTKDPVAKEAEAKSSKGVISGTMEAVGTLAPVLLMTPFPELAPVATMVSKFAPFVRSLGLCKPDSVESTKFTVNAVARDLVQTHGMTHALKMSLHPEAALHGTKINEMRVHQVKHIQETAGYIGTFVLDEMTLTNSYLVRFPSTPSLAFQDDLNSQLFFPTWVAYVSQFFSTYKGGMKYIFEFVTTDFTMTRVRFWHLPCDHQTSTPDDFAGSAVTSIVEVHGVTLVEVCLPKDDRDVAEVVGGYCNFDASDLGFALAIPQLERHPFLAMDLVAPVTTTEPGDISTIYVNMYAAAAEDMEFLNYQGFNLRPPSTEVSSSLARIRGVQREAEKGSVKKSLHAKFDKPFHTLVPARGLVEAGLVSNEHVGTVESLLKRYERFSNPNGPLLKLRNGAMELNQENRTMAAWSKLFMWYRGSFRFKILVGLAGTPTFSTSALRHYPYYPEDAGGGANSNGLIWPGYYVETNLEQFPSNDTPPIDIEILWDSTQYAAYCNEASAIFEDAPARASRAYFGNVAQIRGYWAVGEDFTFGQLLCPPSYEFPAIPPEEQSNSSSATSYVETELLELAESSNGKGKKKA